jgi:hypothetical protein
MTGLRRQADVLSTYRHFVLLEYSSHVINSVARWRCKCGASIKVLTETDRAQTEEDARREVNCPECGDAQIVLAHRIIEVTIEKPDTSF